MLIDTHCHLDIMIETGDEPELLPENIQAAKRIVDESCDEGVCPVITIGTTLKDSRRVVEISLADPRIMCTVGLHPCDGTPSWKEDLAGIEKLIDETKPGIIVGIGEIGCDFYHAGFNISRQKELFTAQLELAVRHSLPVVIHTRNAFDETIEILRPFAHKVKGVVHCFSENLAAARHVVNAGFLIGIGGAVTYPKNNQLRDVVMGLGLEHLILETDAPFLPPQIVRGQKNHPRHVATIATFIADLLRTTPQHVEAVTTRNAIDLFNLPKTLRHS